MVILNMHPQSDFNAQEIAFKFFFSLKSIKSCSDTLSGPSGREYNLVIKGELFLSPSVTQEPRRLVCYPENGSQDMSLSVHHNQ